MGFGKRALAGAIAVGVALAGASMLVQPAQAATSGVKVAAVKTGNGSLTTPTVKATGKAKVTSKSYKITKSGKKVTTTSKAGTYKVKTTVKYKVGKKKKTYTKTSTVKVKKTAPVMSQSTMTGTPTPKNSKR